MGSSKESGRDRALHYLRETVLVDPEVQGTFLNEAELATRIGVSRTPVREALLLLVADGLVEMLPSRGAYVPPMTGRQIRELMELRAVLERHAAAVTLAAGTVPLAAMREALEEQRVLAEAGDDPTLFIELDMRFHQALVDATGNALLAQTYAGLRVRQRRVGVTALFRTADRQRSVCAEHGRIVDALDAGDAAAAAAAIDEHLRLTERVLLQA
ncbi:GntR family transcriptional regulator [Amycolatopsis suaedae]|uniref:GntR family transcriptional regulator n=1 Tax=Amycolatopsis suaedae TaxID=2510978 RepID=A0A4Q7J4A0_9PSEU|nr:GntR family transcriptional regulator [Amycolatopsis suaedae]RZQ62370.1 GntR family transcriptional regulator [Amycolatopsis suaedae]